MLRATTNRLHRGPHIFVRRQQVPAGGNKLVRVDPAPLVDLFRLALHAGLQHLGPDDVAIALDHAVRVAALQRFFGVKRGVNAAIDHPGAALSRHAADFIAAQGIPGMNPDADKVSRLDARGNQRFERLVHDDRIAKRSGGWLRPAHTASGG